MMRRDKTVSEKKDTGLARTTESPLSWFDEVDRWFDSFRQTVEDRFWGGLLAPWEAAGQAVREPLVDVIDKGSEFVVRAELPGVSKENVDLTVTADGIEIRAQTDRSREEREKHYTYQERTYRTLRRYLRVPEEVKADLATATLKDGILEVRVPKKKPTPESKPVKVPVE
ncbi:MAG: Hsp20/alpha crystallin family protein [Thermoplasmata archaeon]|nr:Hsp20/alpha crystallin family protein [Thermoplasmata archaeon]